VGLSPSGEDQTKVNPVSLKGEAGERIHLIPKDDVLGEEQEEERKK
jgi:hypothetical protein